MSEDDKRTDEIASGHAAALSARGAAKGGRERAKKLSSEKRIEIAHRAAAARWSKDLPRAIAGSPERPLRIGQTEIPCYVLEDGRRLLSQRGLQAGVGMSTGGAKKSGEQRMANFIGSLQSKGLEGNDLVARLRSPILFLPPGGGRPAFGYEATILPDVCDAVLEARKHGLLQPQQEHIAHQCELLVRGFARVGIIALVDEATGFQDLRSRDALAKILEAFIATELRKWVKTFPADFYREIYRLRNWKYPAAAGKRPQVLGHFTNDVVYDRLAPGVRAELHRITPRDESGRLKQQLHRWLSEDVGHPKLREHLSAVIALMKASDNWDGFKRSLDRALPKYGTTMLLPGA